MRHITNLEPDKVPKDDHYEFRNRARTLVDKWHLILPGKDAGEKTGLGEKKEKGDKDKAAGANGTANGAAEKKVSVGDAMEE
jgi:hypothetical protein